MSTPSMQEVFAALHARGLVSDAAPPALPVREAGTPWYVRVMAGFGAWLGGLFLLGSAMSLFALAFRAAGGMIVLGMGALVVAFFIYHAARKSEALQQLGLAASMAGQFALGFGVDEMMHWHSTELTGFLCLMQLALMLVMPSPLHRFISAWFAALAGHWFLHEMHAVPLGGVALVIAVTGIWLMEARWTAARQADFWRPVGYAWALALLFWEAPYSAHWVFSSWEQLGRADVPAWLAAGAYVVCLVATAGVLALRQAPVTVARWVVAALLVGAVAWLAPGLIAALLVLVLGVAVGNRILTGLALLAGVWYLGAFYYQMHLSLLQKSWVLIGSGLVLIALRFAMSWFWRAEAEHD